MWSKMHTRAKPGVNFFTRVDLETDERRRRLQQRMGYSAPRLVDEALRAFEAHLDDNMARARQLKERRPDKGRAEGGSNDPFPSSDR
jgi:hypothetical protein